MAARKGNVRVTITGDASHLDRETRRAEGRMSKFGAVAKRAAFAGAAGIAAGTAASIKSFADFDSAMTASLAIMGDVTRAQRQDMVQAARAVGRETKFSAREAAEGYFFLASAGLDAVQSVKAMPAVAKFAQAGNFDLALATDLVTDAQSALGLSSKRAGQNLRNMTRVSDVLVKANTLANASVEQFSESLTNKVGASAKVLGKDVEETTSVLAAFADQGVKGREAGTALSIVWRDLQTASLRNKRAFRENRVAVFDANGEMRHTSRIVGDLEKALAGMSDREKKVTLARMGFTDRSQAFLLTLLGSSRAIATYDRELRRAGGTSETVARKQMRGLTGAVTLLKSQVSDAALSFGGMLAPHVEKGARAVTGFIDQIRRGRGSGHDFVETLKGIGARALPVAVSVGNVALAIGRVGYAFGAALAPAAVALATFAASVGQAMAPVALTIGNVSLALGQLGMEVLQSKAGLVALTAIAGALVGRMAALGVAFAVGKIAPFVAGLQRVVATFLVLRALADGSTVSVLRLAAAQGVAAVATRGLAAAMASTGFGALLVVVGSVAGAMLGMSSATRQNTTTARDLTDALRAQADAMRAVRDIDIDVAQRKANLESASVAVAQAQRDVNRLVRDGKKGTLEYRQAVANLRQAKVQQARAERELGDAEEDSKRKREDATTEAGRARRVARGRIDDLNEEIRALKAFADWADGDQKGKIEAALTVKRAELARETDRVTRANVNLKQVQLDTAKASGASKDRVRALRSELGGLRERATDTAERVRRLQREIAQLKSKQVQVKVNLDLLSPDLVPGGGPSGDGWGLARAVRRGAQRMADRNPLAFMGGLGGGRAGAVDAFTPIARRMGLAMSSGFRPGSVTSSGNQSYHALNRARDYAGSAAAMMAFARFMAARFGSRLKELIYSPLGFCVPLDTLILTREGWKRHDEVNVGDETIGYNQESGRNEWTTVREVHHFDELHELVEIQSKNYRFRSTPNHRWMTERRVRNGGARAFVEEFADTHALTSEHKIIAAANLHDPREHSRLSERDAAIVGWLITDGHVGRNWPRGNVINATIFQKKQPQVDDLRGLLRGVPHSERARLRDPDSREFRIESRWVEDLLRRAGDDLEQLVLDLSPPARQSMFDAMFAAEGTTTKTGQRLFSQNEGPVLEAFVLLAYLVGERPSRARTKREGSLGARPHQVVTLARQRVGGVGRKLEPAGREPVWCVTTDLGTWTAQQGGVVTLTGNSIKNGQRVAPYAVKDHRDHVHVAMRRGGIVPSMLSPGEVVVTPGGHAFRIPGRPTAGDTVPMGLPLHSAVLTGHGQQLMAGGSTLGEAVLRQRPHFRRGGVVRGKVSTFGPPGEAAGQTASGLSSSAAGIALNQKPGTESGWNNSTTDRWVRDRTSFLVAIGRHKAVLPVIDKGPAGWTGRAIDVTGAGARKMGIDPAKFPTDKIGIARQQGAGGRGRDSSFTRLVAPKVTFPLLGNMLAPLVDDALLGGIDAGMNRTGRRDLLTQVLEGIVPEAEDRAGRERVTVKGGRVGRRVQRMVQAGDAIAARRMAYQYGGYGNPSYDCSGLASRVLNAGGLLKGRLDTVAFKGWGKPGRGGLVTLGIRGGAGRSGHMMMRVADRYYEASGAGVGRRSGWSGNFDTWRRPAWRRGGIVGPGGRRMLPPSREGMAHLQKLSARSGVPIATLLDPRSRMFVGWGLREGSGDAGSVGRTRVVRGPRRRLTIADLLRLLAGSPGTDGADRLTRQLARAVSGAGFGSLLRQQRQARRRIRDMSRDGFTGAERIQTRRLRGAITLVQDEMGRQIGRPLGASDRTQERIGRQQSRFEDELTLDGIDLESGEGRRRQDEAAARQIRALRRRRRALRRALRRARRTGNREAMARVRGELNEVDDQILGARAGRVQARPTEMDFAQGRLAQASLTAGKGDDLAALTEIRNLAQKQYEQAVRSGDPRDIAEAANNLKQATDALRDATPTAQDFASRDLALAQLTDTLDDDHAALLSLKQVAEQQLQAALASGDPRDIADAANNLKQAADALRAATPTAEDFASRDLALAQLTETKDDDLAALQSLEALAREQLAAALLTADPRDDIEAANNLKAQQDALKALTEEMTRANELAQQRMELERQRIELDSKMVALAQTQGPATLAALVGLTNDTIGRTTHRAGRTPGLAGVPARFG